MNRYDEKIWHLITRVLSGEAEPGEKKALHRWLEEDPRHREFYRDLKSTWMEEPQKDTADSAFLFDYDSGLSKLRNKLDANQKEEPYSKAKTVSASRDNLSAWKIAASIVLLIISISVYVGIRHWTPAMETYATSNVEQRIISLPDGSRVRLNKNSSIKFPEGFAGSSREVSLKGEAFFKIKHDAKKPFIIHAGDAEIRDIGTSFNVKQGGKRLVVAVREGIVSLGDEEQKTAILKKGQVGVLDQNGKVQVDQAPVENYWYWMNGKLVFDKMPFDQVIRQLEDIYDIDCQLRDSSLSTLKLSAYTEKPLLDEVLDMIALSLKIDYRKKGDRVIWLTPGH